jgi:hypothetical protein
MLMPLKPLYPVIALISTVLLSPAPARSAPPHDNNFDSVILKPGDSRICPESPCEVFFVMPRGKGKREVSGLNVFPGRYPSGKTVYFGRFWPGSYDFAIKDSQAPTSYLFVGGGRTGQ